MKKFKHYLSCYKAYFRTNLLVFGQYKIDFLAINFASVLILLIGVINIEIIFSQTDALRGWEKEQVLWNLGFFYLVRAIFNTFFINTLDIGYWIRTGKLDLYIVRPLNTFFQLLSTGRYNTELPFDEYAMGIGLMIVAREAFKMPFAAMTIIWFVVFLLLSTAVYFALRFIVSATAFWSVKSHALGDLVWNFEKMAEYPMPIYQNFMKFFVTFILPFAFVCYYPASVFLGKRQIFEVLAMHTVIVAALLVTCILLWRKGMKIYQSTGS
jgi:ABC-2 type transport system permease protein